MQNFLFEEVKIMTENYYLDIQDLEPIHIIYRPKQIYARAKLYIEKYAK